MPIAMENLSKYTHIYYLNESLQRKYQENKVGNCFNIEKKVGFVCLGIHGTMDIY